MNDTFLPNRHLTSANRYSPSRSKSLFLANYRLSHIENIHLVFYTELIPDADDVIVEWETAHRKAANHRMSLPPHRDYVLEFHLFGVLASHFRDVGIYVGDSVLGTYRFFQVLNGTLREPLSMMPLNKYSRLDSSVASPKADRRVIFFSYSYMTDIRYFDAIISALNASKGVRADHVCQRYCYAASFGHDFIPYEVYRPAYGRIPQVGNGADRELSYAQVVSRTYAFQREVFKDFLEREAPDVVVTRDDTLPFIAWLDEFRREKGFEVIHVPHGLDQISRAYEVDPWFADKCALGLPGYERAGVGAARAARRAVLTGDLLRPAIGAAADETALRRRCEGKKVLFLPAQGVHETRVIIELVMPVLQKAPDYLLVIKRNSFEDFIDYEFDTREVSKAQVCVTDHRDINAVIGISHALITANSTSFLNAIALAVPVLAFWPLLSRTILEEAPGVLRFFETSDEIAAILRELDRIPPDGRRRAADAFLRRYFPFTAPDAATNITELVLGEGS